MTLALGVTVFSCGESEAPDSDETVMVGGNERSNGASDGEEITDSVGSAGLEPVVNPRCQGAGKFFCRTGSIYTIHSFEADLCPDVLVRLCDSLRCANNDLVANDEELCFRGNGGGGAGGQGGERP